MLVKTEELTPSALDVLSEAESHQIYCGLDCGVTFEVFEAVADLLHGEGNGLAVLNDDEKWPLLYSFERALQAPALDMMLRGFKIDGFERARGIQVTREELAIVRGQLDALASSIWDKGLNANSPKQLKEFFYHRMRLPEVWISQKGERKLSTNREALEKLDVYFHARPIIALIFEIRDLVKRLSVLETEVSFDGRMRTSYNIGGTSVDRWSSSSDVTGVGCVLPTAEALTRSGWKPVCNISDGEEIVQYSSGGSLEFVPCSMFKTEFAEGNLIVCKTEQFNIALTPEHRTLHFGPQNTSVKTETALKVSHLSQTHIPLGGNLQGGSLNYPPYLAMLMADFSKEGLKWRGAFKKSRKIKRFLSLAAQYGIQYEEQIAREGYRRFAVKVDITWPKTWGSWILNLDPKSASALLEEARHWDAHDRGSGFIFFSASREQAEWFATLAHIAGKSATVRREEQNEGSYSNTTMWWVNVKSRQHVQVKKEHWSNLSYSGLVYCPQVPSSYWLVRHNGFISVTGNTNLQNITPELRRMFIADEGKKICGIDLEQSEARDVGFLCGILFGDWTYLDACEAGDLHTNTAKLVWPTLPWTGNAKADREIAEGTFYRHFSYRDMSKRGGHATNYVSTPFTMARNLKIPIHVSENFQSSYFNAYPAIPRYHQWAAQMLQQGGGRITTPFGASRQFFGRPDDDATLRKAVAYSPASMTGNRLNLGLLRIWRDMRSYIELLAQVHDAVYFQYDECSPERENEIVSAALSRIRVELKHEGRSFVVPGEAKIGWNWASKDGGEKYDEDGKQRWKFNDGNPDGLVKWSPNMIDKRTRSPNGRERLLA